MMYIAIPDNDKGTEYGWLINEEVLRNQQQGAWIVQRADQEAEKINKAWEQAIMRGEANRAWKPAINCCVEVLNAPIITSSAHTTVTATLMADEGSTNLEASWLHSQYDEKFFRYLESTQLVNFLDNLAFEGIITDDRKRQLWSFWNTLEEMSDHNIPVPVGHPGAEGHFLFTWKKGNHYIEVESIQNDEFQFFYHNEVTGETWEEDFVGVAEIPSSTLERFLMLG